MSKKLFWLGFIFIIGAIVFPVSAECQNAPGINQSTLTITRDSDSIMPLFSFKIYLDNSVAQNPYTNFLGITSYRDVTVSAGETIMIPINDGAHSIHVKAGMIESNKLTFTANKSALRFYITMDAEQNITITQQ